MPIVGNIPGLVDQSGFVQTMPSPKQQVVSVWPPQMCLAVLDVVRRLACGPSRLPLAGQVVAVTCRR